MIFDEPIYVGICILYISKTLMYDFHYDTIKKKYKDKAELIYIYLLTQIHYAIGTKKHQF